MSSPEERAQTDAPGTVFAMGTSSAPPCTSREARVLQSDCRSSTVEHDERRGERGMAPTSIADDALSASVNCALRLE